MISFIVLKPYISSEDLTQDIYKDHLRLLHVVMKELYKQCNEDKDNLCVYEYTKKLKKICNFFLFLASPSSIF